MPKRAIDYNKTIIYKLVSNDLEIKECYVGHTTNFTKRKNAHKNTCMNDYRQDHNLNVYQFIRDTGGWDNWSMIEIEKYPCNDINEASKRERYWIETLRATLNQVLPARSKQEYRIIYREEINQIQNQQRKERPKTECPCGSSVRCGDIKRHFKSEKHKAYLETLA